MLWTELAEKIAMPVQIFTQLCDCAKSFDHTAYRAEIEALADFSRTESAYHTLCDRLAPDEDNRKMELCQLSAAALAWDEYRARGIPETVYSDTMAARFITSETSISTPVPRMCRNTRSSLSRPTAWKTQASAIPQSR